MAYSMQKREDAATIAELPEKTASIVNEQLKKNRAVIMATLPRGFNYDRMCRTVINAVSTNSLLAKCSPASIFLSTVRAFALGIEPNGSLSEGYLIPFWDGKKGGYESQFMPSYRGLQNLARRSGEIRDIYAKAVCENDVFEVEEGTERKIVHKPDYTKQRGKTVCYYAVFHLKDGGVDFEVMSIDEIEKVRRSSKAADKGPWIDWYDEMAKKTVMKRLLKRAPMSVELADAIRLENAASTGEAADDVIDIEGLEVADETPAELQKEINQERTSALKKQLAEKKTASAEPDNLTSVKMMIGREIESSHAPVAVEDVLKYAAEKKTALTIETDIKALVKQAAEASLALEA